MLRVKCVVCHTGIYVHSTVTGCRAVAESSGTIQSSSTVQSSVETRAVQSSSTVQRAVSSGALNCKHGLVAAHTAALISRLLYRTLPPFVYSDGLMVNVG